MGRLTCFSLWNWRLDWEGWMGEIRMFLLMLIIIRMIFIRMRISIIRSRFIACPGWIITGFSFLRLCSWRILVSSFFSFIQLFFAPFFRMRSFLYCLYYLPHYPSLNHAIQDFIIYVWFRMLDSFDLFDFAQNWSDTIFVDQHRQVFKSYS